MITCRHLSKKFDRVKILDDFSYVFEDTGLYVLYGASGSGKTTFLHILLGIMNFDSGSIDYDHVSYTDQVDYSSIQKEIAYISQESYFIDYLTMEENLILESRKSKEEVLTLVRKFGLDAHLHKMPNQISGGEKSRFSLIGNILKEKKIFFLDEPTASLDRENRKLVYDILDELKKDCLIICATHDHFIFEYHPEIIDFNCIDQYKNSNFKIKKPSLSKKQKDCRDSVWLVVSYLVKQIKRCEKKLLFIYVFIFSLALLLIFACTDYESKLFTSLTDNYHLRSVRILCSLEAKDYCSSILSEYHVSENVYHYIRNIPEDIDGVYTDFQLDILSLPMDQDNIYDVDRFFLYGNYYSSRDDVILGYDKAVELSDSLGVDMDQLLGESVYLNLPDGSFPFKIVGIFKKMNDHERNYFKSILGTYDFDNYYYINQKYQEKYLYDDVLGMDEKSELKATSFTVYFKEKRDFLRFYNDYKDKDLDNGYIRLYNPTDNFADYYNTNELVKLVCSITSFTFFILAMVFYYQIHKTRITYTEQNFSIFEYFGYSEKTVKRATVIYFMLYISFVYFVSVLVSSSIAMLLNQLIINSSLLPFSLFVIDQHWILLILVIIWILAFFEGVLLNKTRKKKGWFYLIKEKSDLL